MVGPLIVELCRIMDDGEKHRQELCIVNLGRIVRDLYRFGVTRLSIADLLITRVLQIAARVSGPRVGHTLDMLVNRLDSPEAAARKNSGFYGPGCRSRDFGSWSQLL